VRGTEIHHRGQVARNDRESKTKFPEQYRLPTPKGEKNKTTFSRYCSGEVLKVGRNEEIMYTGTLIDDLIKTVEQAEKCSQRLLSSEEKLAHFYQIAQFEMAHFESRFVGVA
jgi:hypothetical protein